MTNHIADGVVPLNETLEAQEAKPENNISRRGWRGDSARHAEVGSVGGNKVAEDREHMAAIGKKGGAKVSQNRAHMSEIGRKGGLTRATYAQAKKGTETKQGKTSKEGVEQAGFDQPSVE